MAHFAKLDKYNVVTEVVVVNNEELLVNGVESEEKGIVFLTLWSNGYYKWRQTSYNRSFRKNYAGVGYTYDEIRDAFILPKPFPSWVLNEDTCEWKAPVPLPDDGNSYQWNEETQSYQRIGDF
jgi:hypothetical protein